MCVRITNQSQYVSIGDVFSLTNQWISRLLYSVQCSRMPTSESSGLVLRACDKALMVFKTAPWTDTVLKWTAPVQMKKKKPHDT